MKNNHTKTGMVEIFCRCIHKNGRVYFPKNAEFFHFWVPADKVRTRGA